MIYIIYLSLDHLLLFRHDVHDIYIYIYIKTVTINITGTFLAHYTLLFVDSFIKKKKKINNNYNNK